MAKANLLALLFITLFLVPFLAFPQESNAQASALSGDWPMFQHDITHTGYTSSALSTNPVLIWSFADAPTTVSDIAVSNDRLYFSSSSEVFAISALTGQLIWRSPASSSNNYRSNQCPTVSGEYVYTNDCAYYASTGHLSLNYSSYKGCASPVIANGILLLTSNFGSAFGPDGLIALDIATGAKLWEFNEGGNGHMPGFRNQPAAVENGSAYFSCRSGVYAFDVQTGNQLWNKQTDAFWGSSSAVVAYGFVYVYMNNNLDSPGMLYCLDALTGEQKWAYPSGYAQPAVTDGVVYANSYALNAYTGKVIWNNGLTGISIPAVAGGAVYYDHIRFTYQRGSNSIAHEIFSFNASTGNMISNITFPVFFVTQNSASPVIASGRLFAFVDHTVFALGALSESPTPIPSPTVPEFLIESLTLVLAASTFVIIVLTRIKKEKTNQILG